jgi:hypothetical protein
MIQQNSVRIVYFITVTKYHDRNAGLGFAVRVHVEGTQAMLLFFNAYLINTKCVMNILVNKSAPLIYT